MFVVKKFFLMIIQESVSYKHDQSKRFKPYDQGRLP